MGDVFNQGIHQMLSPGVCIMTLKAESSASKAIYNRWLHIAEKFVLKRF